MKNELEFGPHELLLCRLEFEFCTCSSSCAHCRFAIEKHCKTLYYWTRCANVTLLRC